MVNSGGGGSDTSLADVADTPLAADRARLGKDWVVTNTTYISCPFLCSFRNYLYESSVGLSPTVVCRQVALLDGFVFNDICRSASCIVAADTSTEISCWRKKSIPKIMDIHISIT